MQAWLSSPATANSCVYKLLCSRVGITNGGFTMEEPKFEYKDGQLFEAVMQPVGDAPTQEAVDAAQNAFNEASSEVEAAEADLQSKREALDLTEVDLRAKVEAKADAEAGLLKSQARLAAADAAKQLAEQQPEPEQPAEPTEDPGTGQASGDVPIHAAESVEQPA